MELITHFFEYLQNAGGTGLWYTLGFIILVAISMSSESLSYLAERLRRPGRTPRPADGGAK